MAKTKFGFWDDVFELVRDTGSKTVKTVGEILSPEKIIRKILCKDYTPLKLKEGPSEKKEQKTENNYTPLNFKQLEPQYAQQDNQEAEQLRWHLFRLRKEEEKQSLEEKKQKELEKKRKEEMEEEERKKREKEEREKREIKPPRGKVRRSIFTPLKVLNQKSAERRPSTGKH